MNRLDRAFVGAIAGAFVSAYISKYAIVGGADFSLSLTLGLVGIIGGFALGACMPDSHLTQTTK